MGRRLVWEEISKYILEDHNSHYMLASDFNIPLYPSEKCGGLVYFSDSMGDLANIINATSIFDLEL